MRPVSALRLFALSAALFLLAGLITLAARRWAFAFMFIALAVLYAALSWEFSRRRQPPGLKSGAEESQ